MPPLPDPLDETWLASFNKFKCACTVDEMRRAIKTVEILSHNMREEIWRVEEENIRL